MALSANNFLDQRFGDDFGGLVPQGVHVYAGALCAWTATGGVVPVQNAGAVAFAGLADGERDNTQGTELRPLTCRKGVWAIAVPGAGHANIGQPVYASDDNTASLGSLGAATAAKSGNTGNGSFGASLAVGAGAKIGAYVLTATGATSFDVTDPSGDALPVLTVGAAYADAAFSGTLTAGGTAFVAGDAFTITVTEAGGMQIGTLAGIDTDGRTYVKF